jgi:hypothetical protein
MKAGAGDGTASSAQDIGARKSLKLGSAPCADAGNSKFEIPEFSFVLSQNLQDFEEKVADFQAVDPRSQTFLS